MLSVLLAAILAISCIALPASAENVIQLTYDLASGESNEITAKTGDTITVTYTIKRTDSEDAYEINAIQNEIKYDAEFFEFVSNSIEAKKGEGRLLEKFEGKRVYMNDINASYGKSVVVGTFKLRVIASSGSGKVQSSECVARDSENNDISLVLKDLTVTIGGNSDENSGNEGSGEGSGNGSGGSSGDGGGGGSGGGAGGGVVFLPSQETREYTKDIFGNEHPTHTGYINGYPGGTVKPDGEVTREEITAILYRIMESENKELFAAIGDAFSDVEASRWSARDIEYMQNEAIVQGYPDGEFKPVKKLTRAEFATLIARFAKLENKGTANTFKDLNDTHWAYNDILALTGSGLVSGYPDETYRPDSNVTRAEVMTVINKLLGRKPLESYVVSLEFNPYNDLSEDKWYYVTVLEATITHSYFLNEKGYEYKWEDFK